MASFWCRWPVFFLIHVLLVPDISFCHSTDTGDALEDTLTQKAEYHMKELVSTIQKLKAVHRLHKRDVGNGLNPTISDALHDLCAQLAKEPPLVDATTTLSPELILKDKMENDISYEGENHPSNWPQPKLVLISVEAKREETMSHFTFIVSHSSQAFLVRTASLDYFRTTIGASGKYAEPVTSETRVSVNHSLCFEKSNRMHPDAAYTFGLVDDKDYIVELGVELCESNKKEKEVQEGSENSHMEMIFQQFQPARFRIILPSESYGNEIVIIPGKDTEFYVDMYLFNNKSFYESIDTTAFLWDWESDQFAPSVSGRFDKHPPHPWEGFEYSAVKLEIVHRLVLNETNAARDSTGLLGVSDIIQRVKVTIKTANNTLSGRLTLAYTWWERDSPRKSVVKYFRTEADVVLRLPYKMSAMPLMANVFGIGNTQCRNDGHPDSKRNCVVTCYASGNGIQSIVVVKNTPYVPPVKSMSCVVNGKHAEAYMDMGPPSPEIEGDYQCLVITEDGKVTSDKGTVQSYGFTVVHSTVVEDLNNGSARITCEATGWEPFHVFLKLEDKNYHHITLEPDNEIFSFVEDGNKTTISVLISVERLLFPSKTVLCSAYGGRGDHTRTVDISWYIKDYNITAPVVKKDMLTMKNFENGTSRISCTASGGNDLNVDIIQPDYKNGHYEFSFEESDTQDGKSIVLYLPTRIVSLLADDTYIICRAKNDRGSVQSYIDRTNIEDLRLATA